jgi:hypothetical protein
MSIKMNSDNWQTQFRREIERGELARSEGNEGMARVCSRRAAGIVVREYLSSQDISARMSVLNALKKLSALEFVSPQVNEIASHFVWQITTEHVLPREVDLIREARWLAKELLNFE